MELTRYLPAWTWPDIYTTIDFALTKRFALKIPGRPARWSYFGAIFGAPTFLAGFTARHTETN
jgi:hypothetical protein